MAACWLVCEQLLAVEYSEFSVKLFIYVLGQQVYEYYAKV